MICPANWRQSGDELRFVIEDFDPKVVVWQEEEIGAAVDARSCRTRPARATWLQVDGEGEGSYRARRAVCRDSDVELEVQADSPLLVIYTAAIIDRPNGSMLTHRNLLSMGMATAQDHRRRSHQRLPQLGPAVPHRELPVRGDPGLPARRHEHLRPPGRSRPRCSTSSPTSGRPQRSSCRRRSCRSRSSTRVAQRDLSSLRAGPFAPVWGDALPRGHRRCGELSRADSARPRSRGWPSSTGTAAEGSATPGGRHRWSRCASSTPTGLSARSGEPGEIVIAGDLVHAGYWNRPELNAHPDARRMVAHHRPRAHGSPTAPSTSSAR